jgi:uroporphyrinogen-III synthase
MPPRVLVTRAPHQASALAEALTAAGLQPVLIPTIELADPTTFVPLDAALASLSTFHWLIFTSANAVEAFHRRLRSNQRSSCRIAAIGPATARALEAVGLRADLMPQQAVAESLADALVPLALQPNGSPTRFLLIRAEEARDILPDTLRAAGADLTIAPAYRTVIPQASLSEIHTLFRTPANYPDAITFTSSSTATNLFALLEAAGIALPPAPLRISIGPITSQTLREHHLPPHAEAAEANISSLVEAVVNALHSRNLRSSHPGDTLQP